MADSEDDRVGDNEHQAEVVLNEIPNDCDMAAEFVPKEMENDHWAYRIVYLMALQETVEITTKRWSPRSHSNSILNGLPNHLTRGLPNDYQEANG